VKVLRLETFEGIPVPKPGAGNPPQQMAVIPNETVKAHALPGGAYVVDWGNGGPMSLIGSANVKHALVTLTDDEKAKLLK
jgi:hypothetical protein